MQRLSRHRGAISVFLLVVFMISYVFMGLLTDAGRYQLAQTYAEAALDTATKSVMSHYDKLMFDLYGLFSTDIEIPEGKTLEEAIEDCYRNYIDETLAIVDCDTSQYKTLLNELLHADDPTNYYSTKTLYDFNVDYFQAGSNLTLGSTANVENQIIEYMKFRAPVELMEETEGFLEKLNEIINMKEKVENALEKEEIKMRYLDPKVNGVKPVPERVSELLEKINQYVITVGNYVASPEKVNFSTERKDSNWGKTKDLKDYLKMYDDGLDKTHKVFLEQVDSSARDAMVNAGIALMKYTGVVFYNTPEKYDPEKEEKYIEELRTFEWDKLFDGWKNAFDRYLEIKSKYEGVPLATKPSEVMEFEEEMEICFESIQSNVRAYHESYRNKLDKLPAALSNNLQQIENNAKNLSEKAGGLKDEIEEICKIYEDMIQEMEQVVKKDSNKKELYQGEIESAKACIGELYAYMPLVIKCNAYFSKISEGILVDGNEQKEKLSTVLQPIIQKNIEYHKDSYYCTSIGMHESGNTCVALNHGLYRMITMRYDPQTKEKVTYIPQFSGEEGVLKELQAGACLFRYIYIDEVLAAQVGGGETWDDYNHVSAKVYKGNLAEANQIRDYTRKCIGEFQSDLNELGDLVQRTSVKENNGENAKKGVNSSDLENKTPNEPSKNNNKYSGEIDSNAVKENSSILYVNDRNSEDAQQDIMKDVSINGEIELGTMNRLLNIGGTLIDKLGELLEKARDNLYVNAYVMTTFPNYKDHYLNHELPTNKNCYIFSNGKESYLASYAEVEYIVTGAGEKIENGKLSFDGNFGQMSRDAMRVRLFGTRLLFNAMSMFTDAVKINQANLISAWAGPFAPLVFIVMIVCWTLAETVIDVMVLMGEIDAPGTQIPLFKKSNDWLFSASGFAKLVGEMAIDAVIDGITNQTNLLLDSTKEKVNTMMYEAYKYVNSQIDWASQSADNVVNEILNKGEEELKNYTRDITDKVQNATDINLDKGICDEIEKSVDGAFSKARSSVSTGKIAEEAKKYTTNMKDQAILMVSDVCDSVSKEVENSMNAIGDSAKNTLNQVIEKYVPGNPDVDEHVGITMDYKDYLYLFLFLTDNTTKVQRIQSVIQANMNVGMGVTNFRLENRPTAVYADAEMSMKFMFLSNPVVPDSMKRNGRLRFKVISSMSY